MNKMLLLYASQTGVTMDITTRLHDQLMAKLPEREIVLKDIRDVAVEELPQYHQVIFGCSTWDHGIPAPDGEDFLSRLIAAKPDLSQTALALFGVGDSAYPEFCGALPLIQTDLERCQGVVSPDFFTIDGFATESIIDNLTSWALAFIVSSN